MSAQSSSLAVQSHDDPDLLNRVIVQRRTLFGDHDEHTLRDMTDLADILYSVGAFEQAIVLHREIIAVRTEMNGATDSRHLVLNEHLAACLVGAQRFAEAAGVLGDVVDVRSERFGRTDPKTVRALGYLVDTLRLAGDTEASLALRDEVLSLSKGADAEDLSSEEWLSSFGPLAQRGASVTTPMPSTAFEPITEPRDLALRRLSELEGDLLESRREIFGPLGWPTLRTTGDLAWTLYVSGRYDEARPLREFLAADARQRYGEHSLDTATILVHLGLVLDGMGDFDAASRVWGEVVDIRRGLLGVEDATTLEAMAHLEKTLRFTPDTERGIAIAQEVLDQRRAMLGPRDPKTLQALGALVWAYVASSDPETAAFLGAEHVALATDVLGPDHEETLYARGRLAVDLKACGRLSEARELEEETLVTRVRIFGESAPATIEARSALALTLGTQREMELALDIATLNADLAAGALGPEDATTLTAMAVRAAVLVDAGHTNEGVALAENTLATAHRASLTESHRAVALSAHVLSTARQSGEIAE